MMPRRVASSALRNTGSSPASSTGFSPRRRPARPRAWRCWAAGRAATAARARTSMSRSCPVRTPTGAPGSPRDGPRFRPDAGDGPARTRPRAPRGAGSVDRARGDHCRRRGSALGRAVTPRLPADHIGRVPSYPRAGGAMMAMGLHEQATSNACYAAFGAAHALLATAGVAVMPAFGRRCRCTSSATDRCPRPWAAPSGT